MVDQSCRPRNALQKRMIKAELVFVMTRLTFSRLSPAVFNISNNSRKIPAPMSILLWEGEVATKAKKTLSHQSIRKTLPLLPPDGHSDAGKM